jgi:hypothetical protein
VALGSAYLITYIETAHKWVAQRRDSHATISSDSADGLLEQIREDYRARPVGRQAPTLAVQDVEPCADE